MIISGTGHRPNKLGGYSSEVSDRLMLLARDWMIAYKPERVITGMALGWDQALAQAARSLDIPYTAAVPFDGQENAWPLNSQILYRDLLVDADDRELVCEGGYAPWKMQKRNEWMVDHADRVLALWDGSSGGTANCIAYANKVGKPITNLWWAWELV